LSREGVCENVAIPPTASGRIVVTYGDGVITGFHSSPQLLYIRSSLAVHAITTPYQGVMCLAPSDEQLICGVLGSGVVRLIGMDGREVRAFVGHVAPVMQVTKLSENVFASSGDDATVRVWDIRDRAPVVSVATRGVPIVSVSGSTDYLVSALQSRVINVFDLRNASGRPVLAVTTDDYEPAYLQYNQREDLVAMFGVIGKEAGRDSLMFLDNDGQNRQRIFRMYSGFLGEIAQ
jgi:WD40 repeat protein